VDAPHVAEEQIPVMPSVPRDRLGRPLASGRPARPAEPSPANAAEAFAAATRRFDEARFFEAHELFEHVWRSPEVDPADREFWKGVTQVAVACCHVQRGNARGALALLARAVSKLEAFPSPHRGVDTRALLAGARAVAAAVRARGAPADVAFPPFPHAG
jgi:uncharacterized protein